MRLIRKFVFRALLALTAICLFTNNVNAKEYIAAKKIYLYANKPFEPGSGDLKSMIGSVVCNQSTYVGCTTLFMSESWDPSYGQWVWLANVYYTQKYPVPQYPPTPPTNRFKPKSGA